MKDSGVPWIGEIPKGWSLRRIGQMYKERRTKVSDIDFEPLSVTMKGVVLQLSTAAKTDAHDDRKLVKKGDFAINSRSDRRGSCGIAPQDGSVSLINTILCPLSETNSAYLNWLFHSTLFADEFYRWGHGIVDDLWTTNWSDMKRIYIPYPSLSEQRRIADFLDSKCAEIDSILEQTKASIEEYKKLKQSVITEAVTKGIRGVRPMKESGVEWIGEIPAEWTIVAIKTVCNMKAGKNLTTEQILEEGPYPVYGGNGIRGYYNEYLYDGECLLVGRQGALCGNVHRVIGQFWPTEHAVVTTPTKGTDIGFLYHALVGANLNQYASDTAAQPGLSVKVIQNVRIPMAPNTEQQEIAAYLDEKCAAIDSLIASKEALITELEAYKKSLIYEYVTGKMIVAE